jgi:hypothetical protein
MVVLLLRFIKSEQLINTFNEDYDISITVRMEKKKCRIIEVELLFVHHPENSTSPSLSKALTPLPLSNGEFSRFQQNPDPNAGKNSKTNPSDMPMR